MPEFGFPAQPRFSSMSRTIASLRDQAEDTRYEAVTGRRADVTTARNGMVSELMQVEKSIADLDNYAESIALSEARADTIQQSLNVLTEVGQGLADTVDMLLTNGTDANLQTVSERARGEFSTVVAALNSEFAGRALFAGDDAGGTAISDASSIFAASVPFLQGAVSSAAAYSALQAEFETPGGTFDTTFYQGGAGNAPLTEIAPGERVDYGVKADEGPMRRILFNTVVLAAAYDPANTIPDNQRRDLIARASSGLRSAVGEVIHVQSRLGTAEGRIASIKARNIATQATLSLRFNDLAGGDAYDAALRLTQIETQLETAYSTTARLSRLSLANFV